MIVIKTEELNYLIYLYFLEQGYSHSAFTLQNEVKMDTQIYKEEVKPGQLVNYLEKAMLMQQLQDHIHMSQYYECKVPTHLIQKHVCQFVEKKIQAQIQDKRDRELAIQGALMRSMEFVGKSGQTIDTNVDINEVINTSDEILLCDWNSHKNIFAIYQTGCVKIVTINGQTLYIWPTITADSISKAKIMKWEKSKGQNMLIIFENGVAQIIDYNANVIGMFNIKNINRLKDAHWNLNWPNIVALFYEKDIEIIDIYKTITYRYLENYQYFCWRFYDQFIALDPNYYINLYQMDQEKPLLQLTAEMETTHIEFNKSKTLLASFSGTLNNIKIWTLNDSEFLFEITDDSKILDFCWCSSQNANYLITLTQQQLNIWDVEFGQLKSTYDIDFNVERMFSMDLIHDYPQVILQGDKLILYDLINRKRRILNVPELPNRIVKVNEEQILFVFKSSFIAYRV